MPAKTAKTAAQKFVASRAVRKPKKAGPAKGTGRLYINAAGKKVRDTTGRIDFDKLYHVQPDGSYLRGEDARSIGRVKKPAPRAKK